MDKPMTDAGTARPRALGRRKLMKIGAGVAMASVGVPHVFGQEPPQAPGAAPRRAPAERPAGVRSVTGAGYRNDANRVGGNGPMDDTSRTLVEFTHSFSEAHLTQPVLAGSSKTMIDTIVALVAGFDSDVGRICTRLSRYTPAGELKSTIAGYGVTTTPEAAAFANSFMVRVCDYNDGDPEHGGHVSVIIPGILAIGEAVHSTGSEVLQAVAVGYEILNGFAHVVRAPGFDGPFEGLATALACGKLLKLDEDRLANAASLALVPHMPLTVSHVGALSHWKSGHSPIGIRNGVFAALMAREGMTGPAQPFEERTGLMDVVTGPFELKLPAVQGHLGIENFRVKRYPAEGNSQAILHQAIPDLRKFTTADEIASVRIEMAFGSWQEIGDPPKWDPRNRETADHSMPYMMAIALTDGQVYLDSFSEKRYLHDAAIRDLMAKITCEPNPELNEPQGRTRITVKKKNGQTMTKDVLQEIPVTYEEVLAKFDRVCEYMSVPTAQRDRAKAAWTNLKAVKDIAEPIRDLARFGRPLSV
jgi:2-methylcitrate dehydratase